MLYRTLQGRGRWDDIRVSSERWLANVVRLTPDRDGRATDPEWRRRRAERLGQLVWQLVTLPDPGRIDAQACVRAAEEAFAVSPDATYVDHYSRYASARTVLGLAYYRDGAWDKAIATLDRDDRGPRRRRRLRLADPGDGARPPGRPPAGSRLVRQGGPVARGAPGAERVARAQSAPRPRGCSGSRRRLGLAPERIVGPAHTRSGMQDYNIQRFHIY